MSYTLSPLLDEAKLEIEGLCLNTNPCAMIIVKSRIGEMTDKAWRYLSCNNNAANILIENIDRVDFNALKNTKIYAKVVKHRPDMIDWSVLSAKDDEDAIQLLRDNLDRVDWKALCANKGAINILRDNLYNIYWSELSKNENAIEILKANPDKVVHDALWMNRGVDAVDILDVSKCGDIHINVVDTFMTTFKDSERHMQFFKDNRAIIYEKASLTGGSCKFNETAFYSDMHPDVLRIAIDKSQDSLDEDDWFEICKNPLAKDIIEENKDNIHWSGLSMNNSDWAYRLLMENKDKIDHDFLYMNENPKWFDMIKEHIDCLDEEQLVRLIKDGDQSWKLALISNEETMKRLFPYDDIKEDPELHDTLGFFAAGEKKPEEIDFLKRWFNEEIYYHLMSRSPAIFQ